MASVASPALAGGAVLGLAANIEHDAINQNRIMLYEFLLPHDFCE